MIYFCEDQNMLDYEIEKIHDKYRIISYNSKNLTNIFDSMQINLFNIEKPFLITNAIFLLAKKNIDPHITELLLKQPNIDFALCSETNNELCEKIKQYNIEVKKIPKFTATVKKKIIKNLLLEKNINFADINFEETLQNLLIDNPLAIKNEINKLWLLAQTNNILSDEDVNNTIFNNPENNIFKLLNFIMKNNLNFFLQLYDNLFLQNTEITEFIQIIAGQLLNLKFIAICQQQKKNYVETISDCKLSPFQYSQYTNLLKFTSLAKITKLLDDLSELDYNIKIGNIDGYHELKILLISWLE